MHRLVLLLFAFVAVSGCSKAESRVVVYCAQDREFAEGLFADFEIESTLKVSSKFDTEANKSVSLAAELEREVERPRCDVHWNNEIIGTIRLARQGVYEQYQSPNAGPFPEWTRPESRLWQSFASRARVLIVNTRLLPTEAERPVSILDLTDPKWKGKLTMAKPQFGTTATHAACLFEALGADAATRFYTGLDANGITLLPGNKQVAQGVARGDFAVGMTDSDDALIELNDGRPVAIIFPDRAGHALHPRLGTLYIPNTLALVKGSPNPDGGKRLIDYLLRAETEAKLAEGGGFQIPLNPIVSAKLPLTLLTPSQVKPMAVDFEKAADLWELTQAFLRDKFAR